MSESAAVVSLNERNQKRKETERLQIKEEREKRERKKD